MNASSSITLFSMFGVDLFVVRLDIMNGSLIFPVPISLSDVLPFSLSDSLQAAQVPVGLALSPGLPGLARMLTEG